MTHELRTKRKPRPEKTRSEVQGKGRSRLRDEWEFRRWGEYL